MVAPDDAGVGMEVDPSLAQEAQEALSPPAGGPGAAPPAAKPAPALPTQPPTEGVKPDMVGKQPSESVPYARFKQVNEDAQRYRQLAEQYDRMLAPIRDRLQVDPRTGQYVLQQPPAQTAPADAVSDQEWALFNAQGLQNGFTDAHWGVFEKILKTAMQTTMQTTIQSIMGQLGEDRLREKTWADVVSEFPEANDPDSDLRQRAERIARENFVQWRRDPNGQPIAYISPQNQYDAVLRAWRQIEREKAVQAKAEAEKEPITKQNAFVGSKVSKGTRKGTMSEKEFEKLSPEQQEEALQQEAEAAGIAQ